MSKECDLILYSDDSWSVCGPHNPLVAWDQGETDRLKRGQTLCWPNQTSAGQAVRQAGQRPGRLEAPGTAGLFWLVTTARAQLWSVQCRGQSHTDIIERGHTGSVIHQGPLSRVRSWHVTHCVYCDIPWPPGGGLCERLSLIRLRCEFYYNKPHKSCESFELVSVQSEYVSWGTPMMDASHSDLSIWKRYVLTSFIPNFARTRVVSVW